MNVLEKILEEIERLEDPYYKDYVDRKHVVDIIRSHMDEVKNDGWIPVEERLPEARTNCLVTARYTGFMGMYGLWIKTGHLDSSGEWYGDCIDGQIIAWAALPDPYKPEEK